MRRTIVALLGCAAVAACAGGSSPVSPLCIGPLVKIDGVILYASGTAAQADLGSLYATVTEDRGCEDVFETVEGQPSPVVSEFENGQASLIPAGTPLHRYNGYLPTERLIAVTAHGLSELRSTPPGQ